MDVQYLTPQDFCNGLGHPLPPAEQRRRFRAYVEAALQCYLAVGSRLAGRREVLSQSAEIAYVRAEGFVRCLHLRPDFLYGGREDVRSYESEARFSTRPYGIPTTSATFESYWLECGSGDDEDEEDW
jgi:hypothetical protein